MKNTDKTGFDSDVNDLIFLKIDIAKFGSSAT
jgi:hypothetical protein